MFTFVSADINSLQSKRKSTHRACEVCRKKKRKCHHDTAEPPPRLSGQLDRDAIPDLNLQESPPVSKGSGPTVGRLLYTQTHGLDSATPADSILRESSERPIAVESSGIRFIGDLNPEGVFFVAGPQKPGQAISNNNVGVWFDENTNQREKQVDSASLSPLPRILYDSLSVAKRTLFPVLKKECLLTIPPPTHRDALCSTYFLRVHPIFPIINEVAYNQLPELCPSRIVLEQGMCLVASMNFSMKQHLTLTDGAEPLNFADFGRRMVNAMKTALELDLVTDKFVLIQALALMSFFIDSRESKESSSLMIGRTVHYVFSLGLHMRNHCTGDVQGQKYAGTLFCCIWMLDRFNAAFQGLPVLIHERDVERSLEECINAQPPSFRLVLRVVLLLDQVIQLYRPGVMGESFPSERFTLFEELIIQCDAVQIPTYQLATIEMLYHATAILSSRSSSSDNRLGSPACQTRQNLSATRLTTMRENELRDYLVLLPFVPYAMSLSLSVAYREMRRSRVPIYRARARNDVQANCLALNQLGQIFWTANVMAQMGNATLRELDRVSANISDESPLNHERRSGKQSQTAVPTRHLSSEVCNSSNAPMAYPLPFDQNLDFNLFASIPELDPFELFDPEIDLDVIDACLEGNLNPACPMLLQ